MANNMFCMQCQETAGNKGCTKVGVCGKSADLANMQDLLIYVTKGLSEVTTRLRQEGKTISKAIREVISNVDTTEKKTKKPTKKEIAKTIETIEQEMREAARNLDFERAMELRDILFEMKSN